MKKLLTVLTLSVGVLGLVACGEEETQDASNQKQEEVAKQKPSTVSVESLKKIKFGDSKATVKKVLGTPKTKEVDTWGDSWEYEGKDNKDSYVTFYFDTFDEVESFGQKGILEKDETRNSKDGIKNFDNPKKSTGSYAENSNAGNDYSDIEDDEFDEDIESDIYNDTIDEIINNNDYSSVSINKVELKENMGTDTEYDLIAHIYLEQTGKPGIETLQNLIDLYSEDLATHLADEDDRVVELNIYWHNSSAAQNSNLASDAIIAKKQFERIPQGFAIGDSIFNPNVFH